MAEHVGPQLIPPGLLVTRPVPLSVTESWCWATNVAVTFLAALMVTWQLAVPEQAPLQPANLQPGSAVAPSVTEVPSVYVSEQSLPQSIPDGLLVTPPFPTRVTLSA